MEKYLKPVIRDLVKTEIVTIFKKGDIICHSNNYKNNLFLWSIATEDDVKNYSGKNGEYYKIINYEEFTTN